jgi:hypothetical protein
LRCPSSTPTPPPPRPSSSAPHHRRRRQRTTTTTTVARRVGTVEGFEGRYFFIGEPHLFRKVERGATEGIQRR